MVVNKNKQSKDQAGFSRRNFMKGMGLSAVMAAASNPMKPVSSEAQAEATAQIIGPGLAPISLIVNGETRELSIEPRETLLEVLRNRLDITGPKISCDRGSCGACTVLIGGRAVYACMTLAVEVQNTNIVTIEGLAEGEKLHPAQEAIVEADAIQCGFCSPGFAMSMAAALEHDPHATTREIQRRLSGHICRCGTHDQMNHAIELAKAKMGGTS